MITTDYNHLSINTSPKSEASQAFDFKMETASKEQNVATKRVYYENLFSTLREDVQNPLQLFKLFEAYATSTCYNQKFNNTKEEGYRRSAKLMEYSFLLQLKHLDLISDDIMDWKSFDSLEELVLNLGNDQDFSSFNKLSLDKDRLHQEAINKEIANTVKDTLACLARSFQNIATLTVSNQLNIAIHIKVNELAEQLLENPKEKVLFTFDRNPFMVTLKDPTNIIGKINAYKDILPLLNQLPDFDCKRMQAKIYNVLGLCLAGQTLQKVSNYMMAGMVRIFAQSNITIQTPLTTGHNYFIEADKINAGLLNAASLEDLPSQKYLSANAKSSLVMCYIIFNQLEDAKIHVEALENYLTELDENHPYYSFRSSYEKPVAIYKEALAI